MDNVILNFLFTVQWVEVEEMMINPRRIVLFPTVHHYAVLA